MLKESSQESFLNNDSIDTPSKGFVNPHMPSNWKPRNWNTPRAKNHSNQSFLCDYCGKGFSTKDNCKRHMSNVCEGKSGGKENDIKKEEPVAKAVKKDAMFDKVVGVADNGGELMFLVKWKHIDKPEMVPAREANVKYEKEVVQFYEERLRWHAQQYHKNKDLSQSNDLNANISI